MAVLFLGMQSFAQLKQHIPKLKYNKNDHDIDTLDKAISGLVR